MYAKSVLEGTAVEGYTLERIELKDRGYFSQPVEIFQGFKMLFWGVEYLLVNF